MWPPLSWLLVGWTALAALWWICALWFVRRRLTTDAEPAVTTSGAPDEKQTLTVFKPLPALRSGIPPSELTAALESFVAQTDDRTDILFGVEQQDAAAWEPVFRNWRQRYPQAQLAVICQPRPTTFCSPKSSWWHALASRAQGQLWLWSDADMVAAPGLLTTLRRELIETGAGLVTCPYIVRRVSSPAMWLEALFVNVEFFPGVLACRAWGKPSFAFGAAMLFRAEDFRQRVRWDELGARMAEDNLLGRRLTPVHISDVTLETLAAETRWRDAVLHFLRWHKTVRWCRPAGYAAEVLITPVLGWIGAVFWQPATWWAWTGLVLTVLLETLVAMRLCARLGCATRARDAVVLAGWSLLRAVTWLACWLPWPVVFRSQRRIWWSLYRSGEARA